jgi:hypothetical protein
MIKHAVCERTMLGQKLPQDSFAGGAHRLNERRIFA